MSRLCRDVSSWQIYSICTTELPLVPCICVNLFLYRPFIGAIYHKAFNDNHQWCCHPNPFRSLLYSPRQFDEAIVIMSPSACVRACVCLTQHYTTPLQVHGCSTLLCVCLCMCASAFVCVYRVQSYLHKCKHSTPLSSYIDRSLLTRALNHANFSRMQHYSTCVDKTVRLPS